MDSLIVFFKCELFKCKGQNNLVNINLNVLMSVSVAET